jgi:hypothetical protein
MFFHHPDNRFDTADSDNNQQGFWAANLRKSHFSGFRD